MIAKLLSIFRKAPAKAAANLPASRKHIRITNYTFGHKVTYYGHNGRRITSRRVNTYGGLIALRDSAKAKGYAA